LTSLAFGSLRASLALELAAEGAARAVVAVAVRSRPDRRDPDEAAQEIPQRARRAR
jgi:hypothetical protein